MEYRHFTYETDRFRELNDNEIMTLTDAMRNWMVSCRQAFTGDTQFIRELQELHDELLGVYYSRPLDSYREQMQEHPEDKT